MMHPSVFSQFLSIAPWFIPQSSVNFSQFRHDASLSFLSISLNCAMIHPSVFCQFLSISPWCIPQSSLNFSQLRHDSSLSLLSISLNFAMMHPSVFSQFLHEWKFHSLGQTIFLMKMFQRRYQLGELGTDGWMILQWIFYRQGSELTGHKFLTILKRWVSEVKLPFSLSNKKRLAIRRMNGPLFPTTLSFPSYDIGK